MGAGVGDLRGERFRNRVPHIALYVFDVFVYN